jgi:RNA polymerase sigma-70 factor (ECF subfamily)
MMAPPRCPPPEPSSLLETLFIDHADRLYGLALPRVGSSEDAEDLVQETFFRALRELRRNATTRVTWPYLAKILRNLVQNRYRDTARASARLQEYAHEARLAPKPKDPERAYRRAEARRLLISAAAELPERYREAFVLKCLRDLSAEETADQMGVSVKTVKEQCRVAKHRVLQWLWEHEFRRVGDV